MGREDPLVITATVNKQSCRMVEYPFDWEQVTIALEAVDCFGITH